MSRIFSTLQRTRKEKRISQVQLGVRLGFPQSHVSAIEAGKVDIRLSTLEEMAQALDLELILVPKSIASGVKALLSSKQHPVAETRRWKLDDD